MSYNMPSCLRWLVCTLMLAVGCGANATQRALLVGVSELVNQPPAMWLRAPRNDVILMRDALLKQGFAAANMVLLADGVEGAELPDAARVHAALTRTLQSAQAGDFVVLYFSGHGTRTKDPAKSYQEPDGLAEQFLARDARGGVGADVAGGIRDVDVEAWINAFLAKDVFVWAVFDTCSATSMTRGAADQDTAVAAELNDEVRFRGIHFNQLLRGAAADKALPTPVQTTVTPKARYVAFFASESHQVTPELRLPRKSRDAAPHGLLTWAIADALGRKPATWRDLFGSVLALYPPVIDELEKRYPSRALPSPVAEGSLDMAIFSNTREPATTRPVWLAQQVGGSLVARAGGLDGLESAQDVRVLATLPDGTVRSADARLGQVGLDAVRLDVPPALAGLSGSVVWTLTPVTEPAVAALRVGVNQRLPVGLALYYPASVRQVADGSLDVRVTSLGADGYRLDLVSEKLADGVSPAKPEVLRDAAALRRRLQVLAQLKWLVHLTELAQDGALDGFSVALEIMQGQQVERSTQIQSGTSQAYRTAGKSPFMRVQNTMGKSVDMVILALGAHGEIRRIYPSDSSETNRFEQGTGLTPAVKRFPLPPWGAGRLVVVASPALAHSQPRLFGVPVRDDAADVRLRGQLEPSKARQMFAAMVRWDTGPEFVSGRQP